MKKNIFWLCLIIAPLLSGCPDNNRTVEMQRIGGTVLVPDGWELLEIDEFERIRKSGLKSIEENGKDVPKHIKERSENAIVLLSLAKRDRGSLASAVIFVLQTDQEFVEMGAETYLKETQAEMSTLTDKTTTKQPITQVKKNAIEFSHLAVEASIRKYCASMEILAKGVPQGLLTIMVNKPCKSGNEDIDVILSSLELR